jgi:hypothetical protein
MLWRNSAVFVVCLAVMATESSAESRFTCAEYFRATAAGQKKAEPAIRGTLAFDTQNKSIMFTDKAGAQAFSIKYDAIHAIQYEKTAKPRYLAAVLISPLFLLSNSKKHYLTIQYNADDGEARSVIVRLPKKHAREAAMTAATETQRKVEQIEEK